MNKGRTTHTHDFNKKVVLINPPMQSNSTYFSWKMSNWGIEREREKEKEEVEGGDDGGVSETIHRYVQPLSLSISTATQRHSVRGA